MSSRTRAGRRPAERSSHRFDHVDEIHHVINADSPYENIKELATPTQAGLPARHDSKAQRQVVYPFFVKIFETEPPPPPRTYESEHDAHYHVYEEVFKVKAQEDHAAGSAAKEAFEDFLARPLKEQKARVDKTKKHYSAFMVAVYNPKTTECRCFYPFYVRSTGALGMKTMKDLTGMKLEQFQEAEWVRSDGIIRLTGFDIY